MIGHCCLPGPCILAFAIVNALRHEHWNIDRVERAPRDDDSYITGDSGSDEDRRSRGDLMQGLSIGAFKNVAGSLVKESKDFSCCFCMELFDDSDDVTELKCDSRHIFHTSCLRTWIATSQSCPICRA